MYVELKFCQLDRKIGNAMKVEIEWNTEKTYLLFLGKKDLLS